MHRGKGGSQLAMYNDGVFAMDSCKMLDPFRIERFGG